MFVWFSFLLFKNEEYKKKDVHELICIFLFSGKPTSSLTGIVPGAREGVKESYTLAFSYQLICFCCDLFNFLDNFVKTSDKKFYLRLLDKEVMSKKPRKNWENQIKEQKKFNWSTFYVLLYLIKDKLFLKVRIGWK